MEWTRPAAMAALALYVLWLLTAFVVRPLTLRRRTGDAGFRRPGGRPGSPAWWGGALFVLAVLAGLAAPVAALIGVPALPGLDRPPVAGLGLLVTLAGGFGAVASQAAMGSAWRVGVEAGEHTGLVTGGAFRHVRNPFFTCTLTAAAGLTLMAPNLIAAAALALLVTAVELQVRAVEEPHLLREHGAAYQRYAATTGRFLPGLGLQPGRAGRPRPRLGRTLRLAENLWFIQGEMPPDADQAPDWCNVAIYRTGDRLYQVDSSGGLVMRDSIERVLRLVGPVASFTLINTHAHLDHICNNDLISHVPAATTRHVLLGAGIREAVLDGPRYFAAQFDAMDTYVDPLSTYQANQSTYRFAGWLRDGLGLIFGRRRVLRWLFAVQFRKFRPVGPSRATMQALDATPARPLAFGGVTWAGWPLGDGDVYVLEARAHTDHDVLVYVPEHRLLCLGDVTFPLFPTWADSSRDRILDVLRKTLAMVEAGQVEIVVDGHGDRCYRGRDEIRRHLGTVVDDHLAFERLLAEIVDAGDGLTPAQIYQAFRSHDEPVVAKYLALEFPHTPPSLQNVMVTTLLQLGYHRRGPRRHQRFYPLREADGTTVQGPGASSARGTERHAG